MGDDMNKPPRKQDVYHSRKDPSGDTFTFGSCMVVMLPMATAFALGTVALVKKVKR